ncbi:hypothetical protein QUA51_12620 [Microcoleus sp. Pol10_D6]
MSAQIVEFWRLFIDALLLAGKNSIAGKVFARHLSALQDTSLSVYLQDLAR